MYFFNSHFCLLCSPRWSALLGLTWGRVAPGVILCFWKSEILILYHERAVPAAGFPSAQTPSRYTGFDCWCKIISDFVPSPAPFFPSPGKKLLLRLESLWLWCFPVQMHSDLSKHTGWEWESPKIRYSGCNCTLFPQKELMWLGRLFQRSELAGNPYGNILGPYTWIYWGYPVGKGRQCVGLL